MIALSAERRAERILHDGHGRQDANLVARFVLLDDVEPVNVLI